MKSKKIVALIVAFAAFMAVATSGLAAVQTTTNYYLTEGKVDVKVNTTAEPGSQVTYLVKNSAQEIVYIDQKAANEAGEVEFTYKIAKNKISDLKTTVDFGTNGSKEVDETQKAIQFANVSVTVDGGAEVAYFSDKDCQNAITSTVVGTEDTIYAKVTAKTDYEIKTATGTEVAVNPKEMVIPVKFGANVAITTAEVVKAPVIEKFDEVVGSDAFIVDGEKLDDEEQGTIGEDTTTIYTAKTSIIRVAGKPEVVGVTYAGKEYPALGLDGNVPDSYSETVLYAVRIIVEGQQIGNIEIYHR